LVPSPAPTQSLIPHVAQGFEGARPHERARGGITIEPAPPRPARLPRSSLIGSTTTPRAASRPSSTASTRSKRASPPPSHHRRARVGLGGRRRRCPPSATPIGLRLRPTTGVRWMSP